MQASGGEAVQRWYDEPARAQRPAASGVRRPAEPGLAQLERVPSSASVAAAAYGLAHVLSLEATTAMPARGGKLLHEDKDSPRDRCPAEHKEHDRERKIVPRHSGFPIGHRPASP
jgi:hypothetical protein